MGDEIRDLRRRVEQTNRAVVATIERCSEDHLLFLCLAERCTVAALACHIADSYAVGADWVQKTLNGEPLPPVTTDSVDQVNAQEFGRNAYRTKREALERLHHRSGEVALVLRTLSDADLGRTTPFALFGGPTTTIRELIDRVLITDPESHLRSIRAAIGLDAPTSGV